MDQKSLLHQKERAEKEVSELQRQIRKLPEGKLVSFQNGDYIKWYRSINGKHTYLPKKDRKLAEQLAVKKYLSYTIQDLEQENKAIDSYLDKCKSPKAEKLLLDPRYRELLSDYFTPTSEELEAWNRQSYEKNKKHPEKLIHKSISGNILRSKSEAMIDMALYQQKIPYRYECELVLGETVLYPDFTIRHPVTGELFYWEHCGMMDNPSYIHSFIKKLETYITNGIIPTIQLILTYETKENPLTVEKIKKIIDEFFCPDGYSYQPK